MNHEHLCDRWWTFIQSNPFTASIQMNGKFAIKMIEIKLADR